MADRQDDGEAIDQEATADGSGRDGAATPPRRDDTSARLDRFGMMIDDGPVEDSLAEARARKEAEQGNAERAAQHAADALDDTPPAPPA